VRTKKENVMKIQVAEDERKVATVLKRGMELERFEVLEVPRTVR
jgi:DNA-binding response OmpR family regulator